jgi:zinc carboxypeptidase
MKPFLSKHMRHHFCLALVLVGLIVPVGVQAATYHDNEALGKRLASLAKDAPRVCRVRTIAKSLEQHKVWLVEVGTGTEEQRKTRPAMLVVAGVEGNDLVGSALVLAWLETLVEGRGDDPNIAKLLETTTLYAIPRLNRDAAEHFFGTPKVEMLVNGKPWDSDHDGFVDEDGPEDLNGDGLITWMRVEDKKGEYILDPNETRLLLKADGMKGEAGQWRYLIEGIDNDKDEAWNEDGAGGVNLNRNFPYNYAVFAPDAGIHQVSEAETRALADFVVDHPNIGIVLTYGVADNLLKTPEGMKSVPRRQPATALDADDVPYYRAFGELYRETLGLDKEMEGASVPGTFGDWMYFHRGRLSVSARPWSPALAVKLAAEEDKDEAVADEEEGESEEAESEEPKKDKGKSKKDDDDRGEKEREQLKWLDEHAPEAFVSWEAFDHPDFPGQRVEIGGYAPFAQANPPESMLGGLAEKHSGFLTELAGRLPRVEVRRIKCVHRGESIFDIEIHVENTGFLPTLLSHGGRSGEVHPTRLVLDLSAERFLAGTRTTYLPTLKGSGGDAEVRCTVHVPDQREIRYQVISTLGGRVEGVIDLTDATIYAN